MFFSSFSYKSVNLSTIGDDSGDSVLVQLSLGSIKCIYVHLNRVSSELPKEVVPTEINEPISGCRLNSVSQTSAQLDSVFLCMLCVSRIALIVVTCILPTGDDEN